jgi:hypothetical protein
MATGRLGMDITQAESLAKFISATIEMSDNQFKSVMGQVVGSSGWWEGTDGTNFIQTWQTETQKFFATFRESMVMNMVTLRQNMQEQINASGGGGLGPASH